MTHSDGYLLFISDRRRSVFMSALSWSYWALSYRGLSCGSVCFDPLPPSLAQIYGNTAEVELIGRLAGPCGYCVAVVEWHSEMSTVRWVDVGCDWRWRPRWPWVILWLVGHMMDRHASWLMVLCVKPVVFPIRVRIGTLPVFARCFPMESPHSLIFQVWFNSLTHFYVTHTHTHTPAQREGAPVV